MEPLKFGLPMPLTFEAPSSWLSRLALMQGQPLNQLTSYLSLKTARDLDVFIAQRGLNQLRQCCSLPPNAFSVTEGLLGSRSKIALINDRLRRDARGKAAFAYCPPCLRSQLTPHLAIHWRFIDWRYCPLHSCLMESRCSVCLTEPVFPTDMAYSTAGNEGHATQRRCQSCTFDLASTKPTFIDLPKLKAAHPMEAHWLMNGRALLAVLIAEMWSYQSASSKLEFLQGGALQHFLPSDYQWKKAEERLRRLSENAPQGLILGHTAPVKLQ